MPKGKKKVAHRVHHRRRVGAASGMQAVIMKIAGIAAGVFVGGEIKKMVTTINPKILGGGMLVAGALAPKFSKGNALIDGIGFGLAAKGADTFLVSMGLITGIGALPNMGTQRVTPKLQQTVGGVMRKPIGAVRDLTAIGAMFDN